MNPTEIFKKLYNSEAEFSLFTPYRVCPVGAHVDHNLGKITGFAIDKGIRIFFSPDTDGEISVSSLQFEGEAKWNVNSVPGKQNDWADHLRGVNSELLRNNRLTRGMKAVIDGEFPVGGLSSSASVTIGFLNALCKVNGIRLSGDEIIDISQAAENNYVGVSCGKLDQICEVRCRKNGLLFTDLLSNETRVLRQNENMKDFVILVFFSGLERSLASSEYNNRVGELRSAAAKIAVASGISFDGIPNMRAVPYAEFEKHKGILSEAEKKRAIHFFSENARVDEGVAAWKNGDIAAFGRVMKLSGDSSIENWEAGSPELIKLHEIINRTDGVYGGRFSGAGFRGSAVAVVDPSRADEILRRVRAEYIASFPLLADKYTACVCKTADGVEASNE
jgi:galactokinase/galacturonokinase